MTLRRTETAPPASPRRSAPLFDPHGLSASLDDGVEPNASSSRVTPTANEMDFKNGLRRGRRRRSSEFTDIQGAEEQPGYIADGGGQRAGDYSDNSKQAARLWWQQPTSNADNVKSRSGPVISTQSLQEVARSRQASANSSSQSPLVRSPAAAFLSSMNDMLSSPTSSAVASGSAVWPSSYRTYSLSPPRQDVALPRTAMSPESAMFASNSTSSIQCSERSAAESQGLAGAAQQLMDASAKGEEEKIRSLSSPPLNTTALRPDDEGARFGPHGRYIIGRMIGYGAFSTIREAWDLGDAGTDQIHESSLVASQNWHRVAVKIVYAQGEDAEKGVEEAYNELEVWSRLPAHPNILPLLYHERIKSEEHGTMNVKSQETIDLLVMPFCHANLLKYVRTGGSLVEPQTASSSRSGSIAAPGLQRTASVRGEHTTHSFMDGASSVASDRTRMHSGRTGSGFMPHEHRSNTIGVHDRIVSSPLSNILGRSASFAAPAGPAPGSILRASSIRHRSIKEPQSKGLPMHVAREIIWQLTEALLCLHHKAAVLHGDLKLENVLGQQWQAGTRKSSLIHSTEDDKGNDGLSPIEETETRVDMSEEANICWRLADFGLSRKVPSREAEGIGSEAALRLSNKPLRHAAGRAAVSSQAQVRSTSTSAANSLQHRLNGGSLAYTAPEAFVVPDTDDNDGTSPYAPDMWAFGCIVYALFAGYLPFMDAFEPRLQNKIAAGHWDMPERLRFRKKGNQAEVKSGEAMLRGNTQSSERSRTDGFASNAVSPSPSLRGLSGVPDMSASLPALPARRDSSFRARLPFSPSTQTILQHGEESGNTSAVFVADDADEEEANIAEEDGHDEGSAMDGTSRDRAAVRQILRGLLEPDARKRLTIRQLAAMEWMHRLQLQRGDKQQQQGEHILFDPTHPAEELDEEDVRHDNDDSPSSLQHELYANNVKDGDETSFSDRLAQQDQAGDEQGSNRGRARRREQIEGSRSSSSVKPIDIDRSKSRSRSRARGEEESPIWALDTPQGGGFNWRQQQRDHQSSYGVGGDEYISHWTRPPATTSRPTSKSAARSSSVDVHTKRGRSTGKATPDSASTRNASRSVSRNRRVDLDLVMPQLSRPRSTASFADHNSGTFTTSESRDSSPALPISSDDHNVARSSFWKSPLRARDRLASLVGGSSGGASHNRVHEEGQAAQEGSSAELTEETKPKKEWWQR